MLIPGYKIDIAFDAGISCLMGQLTCVRTFTNILWQVTIFFFIRGMFLPFLSFSTACKYFKSLTLIKIVHLDELHWCAGTWGVGGQRVTSDMGTSTPGPARL